MGDVPFAVLNLRIFARGLLIFGVIGLPWFIEGQKHYPELFNYLIIGQHFSRYTGGTFNDCLQRQGAHAAHGIHYFFTGDSDNGFVQGKATTEIDGQQWQFAVPSFLPVNVGEAYINVVRAPLKAAVSPR